MDVFKPLSPVIPVFLLIALGFLFACWKKIELSSITEILIYLAAPCLVFTSLTTKALFASDLIVIVAGVVGIFVGVGLLILLYSFIFDFYSRGFALPVLFMNAGNMGIPLALFAFGEPGLQRGTLMFVTISLFQYSLGIYILHGSGGWKEVFRLPLIYAMSLGLFFNVAEIRLPEIIFQPLSLLGYSTIPLMLVGLGYRLRNIPSLTWGHSVGGTLLRIVGGFGAAYATVRLFGIEGVNRQVILLYGSLPSAVVNFVLTEKYGQDPQLAASIVFFTTFFSLISIPLVFWFIL